ncbi:hypothetical protein AZF37_01745 [endosymbiont 'TC1' of Trimyema compressum]|uniref:QueT transporter family protein n=1 Tax=endosymbiont 'TC1' of Trimyema compressum TaxID=243899 RepID=UPI0007F054F1|nr:QueT transporter family protein [endosymbiont 'TC1' of Trimyema compressum]AMP20066.1 hypothetical protein AZF37_01745 [endosymbiont 'TC1' of Trimyema compressum]
MKITFKSQGRFFAEVAIIASLYAVLTVVLPISYGPIQFRIAEALIVLVCFRRSALPGLIVGCLIANLFSPFGLPDVIFGTLATAVGVGIVYKLRHRKIGWVMLPPLIANSLIVGIELTVFAGIPFWFSAGGVFLGEIVILYGLGIPFYYALKKMKFKQDIT